MKRVIPVSKLQRHSLGLIQRYYMTTRNGEGYVKRLLIPDVILVNEENEILLSINSDGFKGKEIDADAKLVFVCGDSCVFGVGDDSWVDRIRLPGHQFVNGGVEGNHILGIRDSILETLRKFETRIGAFFLYGSWHPLYDSYDSKIWTTAYEDICSTDVPIVLATLPSPILDLSYEGFKSLMPAVGDTQRQEEQDPLNLFIDDCGVPCKQAPQKEFRAFLGDCAFTVEQYNLVQSNLKRLNDYIYGFAQKREIPLVDLSNTFKPHQKEAYPEFFFDAIHPQPSKYRELARLVEDEILSVLEGGG
jgi:hypothetical protein